MPPYTATVTVSEQDLPENAPGRLIPYGRRSYYKPDPLPPDGEIPFDDEFYNLLSDAMFWLGKLGGFSLTVDFAPVLYTSLVRKEAMESSEIEGAEIDYNALYSYETRSPATPDRPSPVREHKDIQEVLNYEQALQDGIEALSKGESVRIELLHALHRTLLTGIPENRRETETIGEFKQVPNHLGEFLPAAPEAVEGLMDALLTYIRTGGSYHPLIDIGLVHYQFETIHPYGDGNGRLGRLLIALQLYDVGYMEYPTLYLSEYFNRFKDTYVDRLNAVRSHGEWERWIRFFVEGVRHQAEESLLRSRELETLHSEYEAEYGNGSTAATELACRLFERPYLTGPVVTEMLEVTRPTAYRAIGRLVDEGILEETTGQERNREVRAREIFEILERPPETY